MFTSWGGLDDAGLLMQCLAYSLAKNVFNSLFLWRLVTLVSKINITELIETTKFQSTES